jgi:uncharacterized protein YcnI
MNSIHKHLGLAATLAIASIASQAWAHTTVVPKNTPDDYYVRAEPDGAKSVLNTMSIAHGCNGADTIAQSLVFPNGEHVVVQDKDGNLVDEEVLFNELKTNNNLIMGPKPAVDANWKQQFVKKGATRTYYNHGIRTADTRAFHYEGGRIPNDFVGLMQWRASFADLKDDSCVKEIQVRIPIVNYCERSPSSPARLDAWIGRLTPTFNDPGVVSVGFWPQITIVNKSFDAASCGDGIRYFVSPTDEDIDTFLPIQSFKP